MKVAVSFASEGSIMGEWNQWNNLYGEVCSKKKQISCIFLMIGRVPKKISVIFCGFLASSVRFFAQPFFLGLESSSQQTNRSLSFRPSPNYCR
jgi:hypothetical protein